MKARDDRLAARGLQNDEFGRLDLLEGKPVARGFIPSPQERLPY
ncbi:hypothetical protein SAMN03159488_02389 [Pseudomonas sp. NFIX10]|nr:hypothetical protein SAMN03159488_02389 [Pseudomonas sp. NFIX10]SFE76678.1 hypothetical protein SAMN03159367_02006 [Pseudomonas sp. NFACC06-1]